MEIAIPALQTAANVIIKIYILANVVFATQQVIYQIVFVLHARLIAAAVRLWMFKLFSS